MTYEISCFREYALKTVVKLNRLFQFILIIPDFFEIGSNIKNN